MNASVDSPKLPVLLVTGFLGGGKTTLLRAWAGARADLRMMFLVNDLSESGVDAERMRRERLDTHSVVGGSIFCECKAADFLRMLREDVLPAHRAAALDLLVIETSGIADPMAIGTLIDQSGHAGDLEVRGVMTVITPGKFPRLAGRLPVVDAQVRAADVVVLNKTDTAEEARLQECEELVAARNPDACILRASYGEGVPLDLPARRTPLPQEPLGKCSALAFTSRKVLPRVFPDRDTLEKHLENLPETVLRMKGTVWTAEGAVDLDVTPDTRSLRLATDAGGRSELDVIGGKEAVADLDAVVEGLRARPALIACDVFREELEALTDLPDFIETIWLPMGLHDRPTELKSRVQAEVLRLEKETDTTEIFLLYGLCGNGSVGLRSSSVTMVLPRAHDCIAFLLGSNQQHREAQTTCPGTYFYTPGWIRERRVPGPDRADWLRQEYADRFDEEGIEDLIEADEEAFEHYEKALFIRTAAAGEAESYCGKCAAHMGWRFESVEADSGWMQRFFHGPYPEEEFVILRPGETVESSADDKIFRVVPG